jgi:porin
MLCNVLASSRLLATAFAFAALEASALSQTQEQAPGEQGAQSNEEQVAIDREWIGGAPWTDWTRITGDWRSARTWLEEQGIEVGANLTLDWGANWNGGLRNRSTVMSMPDFNVALDLEQLFGLPRTLVFLDFYQTEGRGLSGDVGALQGVSNIENFNTSQVAEAWFETWFGDSVRFKFGKVDFNSEFAFSEVASEFINPSPGITPTAQWGPTFPNPATSANLFVMPSESTYVGVGVYDGAGAVGINTGSQGFSGFFRDDESDAYFTIVEAGAGWTGGNSWGSGRIAIGGWYHGERFDRFDGGTERGASGGYAILDQIVWRENPEDAEDLQGLGFTAVVGFAGSADIVNVPLHLQAGVVWTGAVEGRDDDAIGLLITYAELSDAQGSPYQGAETIFELVYKWQLTPAVILRPDLQYVMNPSGDPTLEDSLVGMLRMEIVF